MVYWPHNHNTQRRNGPGNSPAAAGGGDIYATRWTSGGLAAGGGQRAAEVAARTRVFASRSRDGGTCMLCGATAAKYCPIPICTAYTSY
jgi:hypothetical protein